MVWPHPDPETQTLGLLDDSESKILCLSRVFAQRSDWLNFSDMIRDKGFMVRKNQGSCWFMGLMEQSEEFKTARPQFTERHVDLMDRMGSYLKCSGWWKVCTGSNMIRTMLRSIRWSINYWSWSWSMDISLSSWSPDRDRVNDQITPSWSQWIHWIRGIRSFWFWSSESLNVAKRRRSWGELPWRCTLTSVSVPQEMCQMGYWDHRLWVRAPTQE